MIYFGDITPTIYYGDNEPDIYYGDTHIYPVSPYTLRLSPSTISRKEGTTAELTVVSSEPWTISSDNADVTLSQASGIGKTTVTVTFSSLWGYGDTATITATNGYNTKTCACRYASEPTSNQIWYRTSDNRTIDLSRTVCPTDYWETTSGFYTVTSNVYDSDDGWCKATFSDNVKYVMSHWNPSEYDWSGRFSQDYNKDWHVTEVWFPEGLKTARCIFDSQTNWYLTKVILPSTLTLMANECFYNRNNRPTITHVYMYGVTPPEMIEGTFVASSSNVIVHAPAHSIVAYQQVFNTLGITVLPIE